MICLKAKAKRSRALEELFRYLEPEVARIRLILSVPGGAEELRMTVSHAFRSEIAPHQLAAALRHLGIDTRRICWAAERERHLQELATRPSPSAGGRGTASRA